MILVSVKNLPLFTLLKGDDFSLLKKTWSLIRYFLTINM